MKQLWETTDWEAAVFGLDDALTEEEVSDESAAASEKIASEEITSEEAAAKKTASGEAYSEEALEQARSEEMTLEEVRQTEAWRNLENLSESEQEELPALELSLELEDGTQLAYEVAGVFVCQEQEYIVLSPKSDTEGELSIMKLAQGENDEIRLLPVEEENWQAVQEKFFALYGEEAGEA